MEQYTYHILDSLFNFGIVKYGDFTLSSGLKSNYYIDLKMVISFPKLLKQISYMMSCMVVDITSDENYHLSGVPYGSLPFLFHISEILKNPSIMVRKEIKKHGTQKLIEGDIRYKDIVLIEDVITTGKSCIEIIKKLENEGFKIIGVVCVVKRGKIIEEMEKYNIKYLYTNETFENYNFPLSINTLIPQRYDKRNDIISKILDIRNSKNNNIILSVDFTDINNAINMIDMVGKYVCGIKLHFDIIKNNIEEHHIKRLINIKNLYNFFVIMDKKFGDISYICQLQFEKVYNLFKLYDPSFIDLVTCHTISSDKLIENLSKYDIGILIVHDMSTNSNINYLNEIKSEIIALEQNNTIGFITQYSKILNNYLTFRPGVNNDNKNDKMDQNYKNVKDVKSDFIILGRSITTSNDPIKKLEQIINDS